MAPARNGNSGAYNQIICFRMRSIVHRTTLTLATSILLSLYVVASPQQQTPFPPITPGAEQPKGEPETTRMQKEMAKRANEQRQAELKRDTEKLLKLSTELKVYVDKTNENVLSMDVIKKADEIEKLAHSVKTKMRGYN
jgi:hypothetical protein